MNALFLQTVKVILLSLLSCSLSEFISWLIIYRTENYKLAKHNIEEVNSELALEKGKIVTIEKRAKQTRRIERLEDSLKKYQMSIAPARFKSMILLTVTMIALMAFLNRVYSGIVVGKLPFVPIPLIRGLSHRGIQGDDFTDCSMTFLYFLASSWIRPTLQKFLGFEMPQANTSIFTEDFDKMK